MTREHSQIISFYRQKIVQLQIERAELTAVSAHEACRHELLCVNGRKIMFLHKCIAALKQAG